MTSEISETFDFTDGAEKAKEVALHYLSGQLRTQREVEQKLNQKGFSPEETEGAIAFLQEYGYVNDADYCRSWIHDRIAFHPCGRMKMAQELAKKISDRGLIRESLAEHFPEETELQLAEEAALQKVGFGRKTVKRDQLMRFLLGRGYPMSVARRALERAEIQNRLAKAMDCETEDDFFDDMQFEE